MVTKTPLYLWVGIVTVQYPEADVLVSSDSLDNDSPTEALESARSVDGIANIGIILLRPSQNSKAFAEVMNEVLVVLCFILFTGPP